MDDLESLSGQPETSSTQEVTESSDNAPETANTPQEIVELEALERFRYGGKEWTPKELNGAILRQSDYTKKSQEIAEERKYYSALRQDLDAIRANPSLVDKFKQIYPEKFWDYLGYVLPANQMAQLKQGQQQQLDPQLKKDLEDLKAMRGEWEKEREEASYARLESVTQKMSEKYPLADEMKIISQVSLMLDELKAEGKKANLNDKFWDDVWKQSHEDNRRKAEGYFSKQAKNQVAANQRGRDSGVSGNIPGAAPSKPRTIEEASELALRDWQAM